LIICELIHLSFRTSENLFPRIEHFELSLDELHNDSTTVTFHGDYDQSALEGFRRGLRTMGITWGHNKDYRPDLKQLLYTLTVTEDGGVPIFFTTDSGNTTDDTTHLKTWELLRELVGRRALTAMDYDNLGRVYVTRQYTISSTPGRTMRPMKWVRLRPRPARPGRARSTMPPGI
jgi:transposase